VCSAHARCAPGTESAVVRKCRATHSFEHATASGRRARTRPRAPGTPLVRLGRVVRARAGPRDPSVRGAAPALSQPRDSVLRATNRQCRNAITHRRSHRGPSRPHRGRPAAFSSVDRARMLRSSAAAAREWRGARGAPSRRDRFREHPVGTSSRARSHTLRRAARGPPARSRPRPRAVAHGLRRSPLSGIIATLRAADDPSARRSQCPGTSSS
jgi:hypothetical protein